MQLDPQFSAPRPPILHRLAVATEDERNLLRSVQGYLGLMSGGTDDLVHAIGLFIFSRENFKLMDARRRWMFTAARDGALSLNNIALGIKYGRQLTGSIPVLRETVDFNKLKEAEAMFREWFPDVEKLRHSVAHQEFYSNPTKDTTSRSDIAGGASFVIAGNSVSNHIDNGDYIATFDGKTVRYSLDLDTVGKAVNVCKTYFAGYEAVPDVII